MGYNKEICPGMLNQEQKHEILVAALRKEENRKEPRKRQPHRDPVLRGVYVRRCKCGLRPWHDRMFGCVSHVSETYWIICSCGLTTDHYLTLVDAVTAWNKQKIKHVKS